LKNLETAGTLLWTSRQVFREFLAVTTRPGAISPTPPAAALEQLVRQFEATFHIADEDAAVTNLLIDLVMSHSVRGKQIHDANIVATMKRYAIASLLTHNTDDFARYVRDIRILPLVV
jgi:predicted nucleic acid-binding protein